MKTEVKTFAAFLAAAMCADDVCDLDEEKVLIDIAENYEIPAVALHESVETWTRKFETLTTQERLDCLSLQGIDVPAAEKSLVFDCVLEILLADGVLTRSEVNFMLGVAEQLIIPTSDAVLLLADFVSQSSDIHVEY